MNYKELLANAPDHDTPEFLEYLRANNTVVYEDSYWLVIENHKYHKPGKIWYTAFFTRANGFIILETLLAKYGHLEWRRKAGSKQTVRRFHFHMSEPE